MSIALEQVTKKYQATPVVNDVSLTVAQGEFLVLLGPSGSGKSTLLRAVAGLTGIDHGRVLLHGRDVTGVAARERGVGFVFQHYALFRHMSVADNIEFALRVRGWRAADRRARRRELLRLVALEGMDERLPTQLSGGQQQRVAVARALAHRPEVLLMDEPFGALDAKIREELRHTIRGIQRELGIATILVTHDREEAFALADRIGVMHQGRLLECGRPEDLYGRPATRFVATFLGPANLVLGFRGTAGVRFTRPAGRRPPREVVAVLRPEEVELAADADALESTPVGRGVVTELLFAGSVERLRVRLDPQEILRDDAAEGATGTVLEVSRTLPQQRALPVAVGQAIAVGARRVHLLPTPISSFTALADTAAEAATLRASPLVATLAERMQTRVASCVPVPESPPSGVAVVALDARAPAVVGGLLQRGAEAVLGIAAAAALPARVVIFAPDAGSRRRAFAVAASLLRHVAAEATYVAIEAGDETPPGAAPRLLDIRAAARAEHGLDVRTELRNGRPGAVLDELLQAGTDALLVLGVERAQGAALDVLGELIGRSSLQAALVVVAPEGDASADG